MVCFADWSRVWELCGACGCKVAPGSCLEQLLAAPERGTHSYIGLRVSDLWHKKKQTDKQLLPK